MKAILEEQYGKSTPMNQSFNKLTSSQLQKRQELIYARRMMLLEAKSLRVRKEESRQQGHFFAFLVEHGWHHEQGLTLEIMQKCISSLANGDYKAVMFNMALAHICKSPVLLLTHPPPHTPSYSYFFLSHSFILILLLIQDATKRNMLKDVWSLLHPDIISMWVMTLVRTNVLRATLEKYVGMMRTFSKDLGYVEDFHEVCSKGDVIDFRGDPFSGDIVARTLSSNRKYRTKIGERPRKCISTHALLPTSTTSTHIHPCTYIHTCTWCIFTHGGAYPPVHLYPIFHHPPTSIHPFIYPSTHQLIHPITNLSIYPL